MGLVGGHGWLGTGRLVLAYYVGAAAPSDEKPISSTTYRAGLKQYKAVKPKRH